MYLSTNKDIVIPFLQFVIEGSMTKSKQATTLRSGKWNMTSSSLVQTIFMEMEKTQDHILLLFFCRIVENCF